MVMGQTTDRRRNRLIEQLAGEGIEKAIIMHPLNILYLTGVRIKPYERFMALILDVKGEKGVLMLPSLEKSVKTNGNVAKVLIEDHEEVAPVGHHVVLAIPAVLKIGSGEQLLALQDAHALIRCDAGHHHGIAIRVEDLPAVLAPGRAGASARGDLR